MSQLTLSLHHASLSFLWYAVNCKQCKATRDFNLASISLFPIVRGDSLSVASARISAVVIRLFVRASRKILRSSRGVVLLEGPVPTLLAELLS